MDVKEEGSKMNEIENEKNFVLIAIRVDDTSRCVGMWF